MTRKFLLPVIVSSIMAICLTGCLTDILVDNIPDGEDKPVGKIVMHQTGGFAGVSRITSIQEKDGSILLTYTDQSTNQHKETPISSKDVEKLWKKLEANDIFSLPTNSKMLESVRDAFWIEITVHRGEKYNKFSVYAPDLLANVGDERYDAIVREITDFSDERLKAAEEFIIRDMPVTDISVQILESFPLQVHLRVSGYLSDSCTEINEITQRRDDGTIYVHITTKRPRDLFCLQVIADITVNVPIEGGFLPGRYKAIVNDVEKDFVIQGGEDQDQDDGILRGKVTIGPLCPVEPCDLTPEQVARVYEARKAFVYRQFTEIKIAEANLSKNGEYSFSLKPGTYIVDISDAEGNALPLDISRRPLIGNALPKEALVISEDVTIVDFDIDTGIR